jgi:glycosyltransferase involved in cell wall biosynthesis
LSRRVTFISWAPYCSRSDNIARELGGSSHMVYWRALEYRPALFALKYAAQAIGTWLTLWREKPGAVLVMSPPVVAVVAVWLYARIARVPFAIDAHTAAFLHPRWRRFQWLQRAMSRRAATTIVTNTHLARTLEAAGAHVTIVRDVPVQFPAGGDFQRSNAFTIAAVCSFADDEPIAEIVAAATRLPDVTFYLTGDSTKLDSSVASALPANLHLTGFLSNAAYGSLLQKADVVLTLTTRDHTMLRGAYEAIYQGTPVIVSDWPLLRDSFDRGAIHVSNTPDAIVAAVQAMRVDLDLFRKGALQLRQHKLDVWALTSASLHARLQSASVQDAMASSS